MWLIHFAVVIFLTGFVSLFVWMVAKCFARGKR